jgi:hypothetical protein
MLNRLLFALFLLGILPGAQAQFSKGDRMLGASLASFLYNSGSATVTFPGIPGYTSKSTSYAFRLEPTIGWFISGQTAVGATLILLPHGQKTRYDDNGTVFQEDRTANFDIGIGGFARHYFGSGNSFMPYGQAGFNLGMSNANTEGFRYYDASPDYKITYEGESSGGFFANGSLQLGLTRMLNEQVGLDLFAGYTYSYNKNTFLTTTLTDIGIDGTIDTRAENEPTTKFTNHGFIVGAGFQIFLTGKKNK